jgi:hypothetical protein
MVFAVWFVEVVGRDVAAGPAATFADPDFAGVFVVGGAKDPLFEDPGVEGSLLDDAADGLPLLADVAEGTSPTSSPDLIPEPVSVKKSRQIGSTLAGSARNC